MTTDIKAKAIQRKQKSTHAYPVKKSPLIILGAVLTLGLSGCNDSNNFDFDNSPPPVPASTSAAFSPAEGGPTTNNLLFAGSTDGTLNIPNPPDADGNTNPVRAALNNLDGFSTTSPITTTFGTSLDPASLAIGTSIRVFQVSRLPNGAVTGVLAELGPTDIAASTAGSDNKTLALVPLKPLAPNTTYMVILTNALKLANGTPATSSGSYLILRGDNDLTQQPAGTFPDLTQAVQLQALINSMENSAIAFSTTNTPTDDDIAENDIILSWSFTTQTISTVLQGLADTASASTILAGTTGKTTKDLNPAFPGIADVFIGTLDIPYYLTPPSLANPTAARTEFWTNSAGPNSPPVQTTTLTIPLILTLPNAASGKSQPAGGWPIVIYQHGITRLRTDALIHADSLASQGIATIAIDLPLHGITVKDLAVSPLAALHAANTIFANDVELTFDMDLIDNATSAAGPDGNIDDSGAHFLNLTSLLTSRDNIRQGVSNMIVLRRSLGNLSLSGINIDTSKVGLIAHSLGGLIGVPYLAVENETTPSSLVTTAGGIAQLVNGSAAFGPVIRAGLAAAGITENADLQAFLGAAQTILDSADPINYGATAVSKHPIHMIEVVGDGTSDSLPDQTVPNTVPQASQPDPEFVPLSASFGYRATCNCYGITIGR